MTSHEYLIREDFAGPGGWDEGLKLLESQAAREWHIIGFEFDPSACKTGWEAGHHRVLEDVRKIATSKFTNLGGYIASPPCQPFSAAGKGEGRKHLDALVRAAHLVATGVLPQHAIESVHDQALDDRSVLVLEPLRVIHGTRPRWVALEQVKEVLPIWQAYVEILHTIGYTARAKVVSAERYGVPQTRKRAILVAVRNDVLAAADMVEVPWPEATHSAYHPRSPRRLDEGVKPWVSMAEALSIDPAAKVGFPRRADNDEVTTIDGVDYRARDLRDADLPAQAVTEKSRSWQAFGDVISSKGTMRDIDTPAPTITASADNGNFRFVPEAAVEGDTSWVENRPSPTIVGSFAPDVVAAPGWRKPGDGPRQSQPGSVRITVEQAGVLQSFRADYPWQGSRTKQFQQVGNAMPPLLAAAFLEGLVTL